MQAVKPSFAALPPLSETGPSGPRQHTRDPKIVGTSVLGMKYNDGIVLAADNLGMGPCLAND